MGFVWRYLDAEGAEAGTSRRFGDREAAEAWMGEEWELLRARGVEAVELVGDGGDRVYRMGLGEES